MKLSKEQRRSRIKTKIRGRISGTAESPRLCVYRSNNHIYVQIVNDITGQTIGQASSKSISSTDKMTKVQQSELVGQQIAEVANKINIDTVRFDRSGYLYHGRVKALAEAARKAGLKF